VVVLLSIAFEIHLLGVLPPNISLQFSGPRWNPSVAMGATPARRRDQIRMVSRSWPNLFGCFVPGIALLFSVTTEWLRIALQTAVRPLKKCMIREITAMISSR
jgi:hypothetical protein